MHSLLALLGGGAGEAVMLPAAACLRYLALAPGAADVMAGGLETYRVAPQVL